MFEKAEFRVSRAVILLAACAAFPVPGCAADPVKPAPSSPAVERAADAGQSGGPTAQPPAKPPPQSPTLREFEPPPVPEFMLRKPAQPLTLEEMKRQADEAAEKARRARAAGGAGSTTSGADAESAGNSSKQPVK